MFVTKKHLSRRTFLRGAGVTLALPFLESMMPAQTPLAKAGATPKSRFVGIYVPHGSIMDKWTPATVGTRFEFGEILKPLEPFRDHLTVVSNLAHAMAGAPNSDAGMDHTRSAATYLSGVHPALGVQARLGTTMDQVVAKKAGQDTPLPSLELSIEPVALNCGSGLSCAYSNTISWKNATTPLPMENNPKIIFEKLFGEGANMTERLARKQEDRSILDSVKTDVARLQNKLPPADRISLSEYLDNVREIERRIQLAEAKVPSGVTLPEPPAGVPADFDQHIKLLLDLQLLALRTEITRISTLMFARELSGAVFPRTGVKEAFHACSHHSNLPANMETFSKINVYHVQTLAYLIDKMKNTADGDGSLLDHSIVLYGSSMSNSNQHNHDPLPVVLLGHGSGQLKGGRHEMYAAHTPMSNLLLSLMDKLGVPDVATFGDSTGKLEV